jgi:hypothetical protein
MPTGHTEKCHKISGSTLLSLDECESGKSHYERSVLICEDDFLDLGGRNSREIGVAQQVLVCAE